ncbi:MAG: hypothetical protein K2N48_05210 [Muribaculaceae bacterium]|nr:hypothetical protein [Muribaculaceae bacterium]
MNTLFRLLLLICCLVSVSSFRAEHPFSWDGATVYVLITDRFCNGDSTNDVNYGRKTDYGSERMNAATFHGGDFAGVWKKAKEGYFSRLDTELMEHFRRLGQIRKTNPVIATGRQTTLDVHTCLREKDGEKVLIRLFPENGKPMEVSGVFPEGTVLVELYSGEEATVKDGSVAFPSRLSEIAVIKVK